MKFKLSKELWCSSDATSGYEVEIIKGGTVREFIDEVLKNKEWGYIGIKAERSIFGKPHIEYKCGEIITDTEDMKPFLEKKIAKIHASGGWSRMDYLLEVEGARCGMSKYIDAERLNMEWQTLKPFGVTDTMIENLKWIVDRQPTIEVSEDCIDRKALLEQICVDSEGHPGQYGDEWHFIDTIENAPNVVPQVPSEDCISRAGLIKSFLADNECKREEAKACLCKLDFMLELIENAPSVVPSRVEGEWIDKGDYAECSNCGAKSGTQYNGVEPVPLKTKFCPNCGARMKGAENE